MSENFLGNSRFMWNMRTWADATEYRVQLASHTGNEQKHNAYRLPKPKQIVRGSVWGFFPSLAKKRSGLNSEGFGYTSGSLSMNLSKFKVLNHVA